MQTSVPCRCLCVPEVLLTEFKRTNKHEGTQARALNAMLTELA